MVTVENAIRADDSGGILDLAEIKRGMNDAVVGGDRLRGAIEFLAGEEKRGDQVGDDDLADASGAVCIAQVAVKVGNVVRVKVIQDVIVYIDDLVADHDKRVNHQSVALEQGAIGDGGKGSGADVP